MVREDMLTTDCSLSYLFFQAGSHSAVYIKSPTSRPGIGKKFRIVTSAWVNQVEPSCRIRILSRKGEAFRPSLHQSRPWAVPELRFHERPSDYLNQTRAFSYKPPLVVEFHRRNHQTSEPHTAVQQVRNPVKRSSNPVVGTHNDQAQPRTSREAGWPSAGAPGYASC